MTVDCPCIGAMFSPRNPLDSLSAGAWLVEHIPGCPHLGVVGVSGTQGGPGVGHTWLARSAVGSVGQRGGQQRGGSGGGR